MRKLAIAVALVALAAPAARAQDADEGQKAFQRQCSACHIAAAEGPKRLGPTLFGVVGRTTGSVAGFRYTEANKKAGWEWTQAKLEEYLKAPQQVIKGTNMAFAGVRNDAERANIVAYLASLK